MPTPEDLLKQVNDLFGPGTLRFGNDPSLEVRYLPTGVLPIDVLLEGGFPRGRAVEIFGDFSTLKSYIALRAVAETQAAGGTCLLIDTEHSFDPEWAGFCGVHADALVVQHPATGEQAVDLTEVAVRSGVDLVVWDSVAATLPQDESEKRATDRVQPARLAALMSRAMRKITAGNKTTALVFINQTRMNVGQMFGTNEAVPGGKALPSYASYRLALRKAGKVSHETKTWDGEKQTATRTVTAQKIRATLEKSKLNKPHRDVYFLWDLSAGAVDEVNFIIARGLETGGVRQSGQMWRMSGQKKSVRGREAFTAWLMKNPKALDRLRASLICSPGISSPGNSKDG